MQRMSVPGWSMAVVLFSCTLTEMGKIEGIQHYATWLVEGLHGVATEVRLRPFLQYVTGDTAVI